MLVETLEGERATDDERPIEQSDNSLVRLLNNMIIEAHRDGVSDIIESYPGREKIRVRFRKDGLLRTYLELPSNYRNAIIARVKIMATSTSPSDASRRTARSSSGCRTGATSSCAWPPCRPTAATRTWSCASSPPASRSRSTSSASPNFEPEGDQDGGGKALRSDPVRRSDRLRQDHDAALAARLHQQAGAEDLDRRGSGRDHAGGPAPVQVQPKIGFTFAQAMRAFLRADPDVIMVGEMRDDETAHGHRGLADRSPGVRRCTPTARPRRSPGCSTWAWTRSTSGALLAVLAQRLVRRICPELRINWPATHDEVDELLSDYMNGFSEDPPVSRTDVLAGWTQRNAVEGRLVMHASHGCEQCDHTGFEAVPASTR